MTMEGPEAYSKIPNNESDSSDVEGVVDNAVPGDYIVEAPVEAGNEAGEEEVQELTDRINELATESLESIDDAFEGVSPSVLDYIRKSPKTMKRILRTACLAALVSAGTGAAMASESEDVDFSEYPGRGQQTAQMTEANGGGVSGDKVEVFGVGGGPDYNQALDSAGYQGDTSHLKGIIGSVDNSSYGQVYDATMQGLQARGMSAGDAHGTMFGNN